MLCNILQFQFLHKILKIFLSPIDKSDFLVYTKHKLTDLSHTSFEMDEYTQSDFTKRFYLTLNIWRAPYVAKLFIRPIELFVIQLF